MSSKTDGLTNRGGASVGKGHQPRLPGPLGPSDTGDTRTQGETFKGLMEGDGDQQDNELAANGHAESHADEDGVEKDTDLEQDALQELLFVLLFGAEDDMVMSMTVPVAHLQAVGIDVLDVFLNGAWDGLGLVDGILRALIGSGLGSLAGAAQRGQTTTDGRSPAADLALGLGRQVACNRFLAGAGSFGRCGNGDDAGGDGHVPHSNRRRTVLLAVGNMTVGVEDHLDDGNQENASQRNRARHGGVIGRPKAGKAAVAQGLERRGQQMDEGGRDQDAGTKVANGKEEERGQSQLGEANRHDREGAGNVGDSEDDDDGASVERRVVLIAIGSSDGASATLALVKGPLGDGVGGRGGGGGDVVGRRGYFFLNLGEDGWKSNRFL